MKSAANLTSSASGKAAPKDRHAYHTDDGPSNALASRESPKYSSLFTKKPQPQRRKILQPVSRNGPNARVSKPIRKSVKALEIRTPKKLFDPEKENVEPVTPEHQITKLSASSAYDLEDPNISADQRKSLELKAERVKKQQEETEALTRRNRTLGTGKDDDDHKFQARIWLRNKNGTARRVKSSNSGGKTHTMNGKFERLDWTRLALKHRGARSWEAILEC